MIFKNVVYGDQYPAETIRRRLYALYALPAPEAGLPLPSGPPRTDRMRAARAPGG
ncbi:hypothetical protein [Streptomyces sp. NPDC050535]|uniref:hypothetical protein n=1 Tax=Streptomyces sp. NPDC050535 TaxID=3365626 RepID=UPI0037AA0654